MMRRWLFSPLVDSALFLGSALVSFALALFLSGELSSLWWLVFVVGIDVAHVWSTLFKVYFDVDELRRRPMLYSAAPAAALGLSIAAYAFSESLFWTLLAYTAAWHFVRQQVGFFSLYERLSASSKTTKTTGTVAFYGATLGPLVWWHAHLPQPFWWMKENDFCFHLPPIIGDLALAATCLSSLAFVTVSLYKNEFHIGKTLLLLATLLAWIGGIVWAQDDFGFTAFNVLLHGVPYSYLVFRYARGRAKEPGFVLAKKLLSVGFVSFILCLWLLAYVEEFLWDTLVWHEHTSLFGHTGLWLSPDILTWIIPLLALPQTTHYMLDGFIWRGHENPGNAHRIFSSEPAQ
jgi:hypothetical protein